MNRLLTASLILAGLGIVPMGISSVSAAPIPNGTNPVLVDEVPIPTGENPDPIGEKVPANKSRGARDLGDCPSGRVCLYRDAYYGHPYYYFSTGSSNFSQLPCSTCTNGIHGNDGTFNNQMSSWYNHSNYRYCWYVHTGYGLTPRYMNPGYALYYVGSSNNDTASSLRRC